MLVIKSYLQNVTSPAIFHLKKQQKKKHPFWLTKSFVWIMVKEYKNSSKVGYRNVWKRENKNTYKYKKEEVKENLINILTLYLLAV